MKRRGLPRGPTLRGSFPSRLLYHVRVLQLLLGILIGLLIGAAAVAALMFRARTQAAADLAAARTRAESLDAQAARTLADLAEMRKERAESESRREAAEQSLAASAERLIAYQEAEARLRESFRATGAEALAANNEQFLTLAQKMFENLMTEARTDVDKKQQAIDTLVKPIRELLEKQSAAVIEIEKKREAAYAGMETHIKLIAESHSQLRTETNRLVSALRRPEQRGRWGEVQLRNVVELAGMANHCDFAEQVTVRTGEESLQKPDMVINLPGGGAIVVDAKVALDAYLDALDPANDRSMCLNRHAAQVKSHVSRLSQKRYWEQFERTPKLVVMFMPLESALVAALELEPELHARAMQDHVLIATPTLLVALLRAVAYGWQQEDVAANARKISDAGRELYSRLAKFTEHLEKLGKNLGNAAESYNKAIGSLERKVLPITRQLKELHATTDDEIEPPNLIDTDTRPITADELRSLPEQRVQEPAQPPSP